MRTAMFRQAILAAGFAWAGVLQAGTPIDEMRPVDADATIRVENVSGLVEISAWDRNEVHLTGELGDGVEDLEITGSGESLSIRVKHPRNARNVEETDLILRVPAGASLNVDTVSADVTSTGVNGASIDLRSVSGDVSSDARTPTLRLNSVSGDISFNGRAERVELETVSGDIEANGLTGEVRVKTVSGDAELGDVAAGRLEAETVSGDIVASVSAKAVQEIRVKSLSGEVELYLPDSLSAAIEAESFSGEIESDFGQVREEGRRLKTTVGDGQGRVRVESFSGEITIRKR